LSFGLEKRISHQIDYTNWFVHIHISGRVSIQRTRGEQQSCQHGQNPMPLTLTDREGSALTWANDAVRAAFDRANIVSEKGALTAGLVGRGIQESRTPRMHEAEGTRLGLRYNYCLLDFDQLILDNRALDAVVRLAQERGFAGLNVTHPFKEHVCSSLDRLSPDAAAIGAVNTIVLRDDRRIGHNTDCWGFLESFRRSMPGAPVDRVVLIGAGGAGLAVAYALFEIGVDHLAIFDQNEAKAAALVERLGPVFGDRRIVVAANLEASVRSAVGIVNATPMGMAKYPGMPFPADWIRQDQWVADIVYFPLETELLRIARAAGCRTLPGIGMAIFQAVKAFELITGVVPDADQMAQHFETA
jgi:shikimate dehydrogenase